MNQPSANTGRRASRRLWTVLFFVGLALIVAFVAWQIAVFSRSLRCPRPPAPPGPTSRQAESRPAGGPAGLPMELAGIEPLEGEPGGISPPPGATRRFGFSREAQGMIEEVAAYDFPNSMAEAAEYYKKALAAKGFALLADKTQEGREMLIFQQSGDSVTVSLRQGDGKWKMAHIELALRRLKR